MNPACEVIAISSDEDEIDEYTTVSVKRKRSAEEKDDEDGDCLIIDGKSENVAASTEYAEIGVDVPDEMLIVGEKGQFACRDYPHPRYLCATFLFSMTPHEKYCDMCHCYVCDCPAPCIYWRNHCNSTHKDLKWRVERQLFKRKKIESQQPRQLIDAKPSAEPAVSRPKDILCEIYKICPVISCRRRIPQSHLSDDILDIEEDD
ncbi:hypothetical protein AXF42_Ash012449 [Apostasia shenzhenica]|uniref:Uncharacterized protein n=1 Tax=Apostasia shenzhenica TaxID=1088818 RepID=A0A2I0AQU2_9ASPA|nr:hypothetical protein AXF42_Ash012449 [Apostasia shenzhenica]